MRQTLIPSLLLLTTLTASPRILSAEAPVGAGAASAAVLPLPPDLAATGLYADFPTRTLAADIVTFTPQYPLWTDGAGKRRYLYLPPGTAIDGSDPDHWVFPVGTKLWKEFAWTRRVETRMTERLADGSWRYATYQWDADESAAVLAPPRGVRGAYEISPGVRHDLPGRGDCAMCHEAGSNRVLGLSALQVSPERDALAAHGEPAAPGDVDLVDLVARGMLVNFPASLLVVPPMINAATPTGRAALGYLHGNCGHCHNSEGALRNLGLDLAYPLAAAHGYPAPAVRTTLDQPSRYRTGAASERAHGGAPDHSVLLRRVASRNPVAQMPPLGTNAIDQAGVDLLTAWVQEELYSLDAAGFVTVPEPAALP